METYKTKAVRKWQMETSRHLEEPTEEEIIKWLLEQVDKYKLMVKKKVIQYKNNIK